MSGTKNAAAWWSVRFEFFIFWYFCGLLAYTSEIYYGIKWKWCIHSVFVALWMHEADVSVKTRRNAKRKNECPKTISESGIQISIECMFCERWTLPMIIMMMINYPRPAQTTGSIVCMTCPRNMMWKMKRKIHPWLFNASDVRAAL